MATINSNWSGWGLASATTSWNGWVVPIEWDKVVILLWDTIEYDLSTIWWDDTTTAIKVYWKLDFSRIVSTLLTCKGELRAYDYGNIEMWTTASPIPSWIIADIRLNYSASLSENKYWLSIDDRAEFRTSWASKHQISKLTSTLAVGGTTVDVEDITDWNISDEIAIATNSIYNRNIFATITGINWNTLTLNNFYVTWQHTPVATSKYEHRAETPVYNLTTNVRIRWYEKNIKSYVYTRARYIEWTRENNFTEFSFIDQNNKTWSNQWVWFYFQIGNVMTSFKNNVIKHWDRALDIYSGKTPMLIENCIFTDAISTWWATFRAWGQAILNNCHIIACRYWISSWYSQGWAGIVMNDCVFTSMYIAATCNPIIWLTLNRCTFDFCQRMMNVWQASSIVFKECLFNTHATYQKEPSSSIIYTNVSSLTEVKLIDCTIADNSYDYLVRYIEKGLDTNSITFANLNLDPLQQIKYTNAWILIRDNVEFRTSTPSTKIELQDANKTFEFKMQAFAPNNKPVVVSWYIKRDALYTENTLPQVTISWLGIIPDTFIATGATDQWIQFKVQATQVSWTDWMLDITISGKSESGSMWLDDVVAPVAKAVNVWDLEYWAGWLPVSSILASYTSANQVWEMDVSQLTLSWSIWNTLRVLENYNDTVTQNKLDIIDTNVDDVESKVNTLNNYNDANVITAISTQTIDLKGASDRDLTEVYNNWGWGWGGGDVDAIAEAVDIKITESHWRGQYTEQGDSTINYRR